MKSNAKVASSPKTKAAPQKSAPSKTVSKKAEVVEDEFISEDSLSTGSSSYMKLNAGENKFRIISKPISGWLEWLEEGDKKKPIRTPLSDGEPEATDDENPPKKFLAMVVLDKDDDLVKILELTQQSVIKAIRALANNPDWGNPFSYDINVNKTGEKMKTKYTVTPSPKKPLSKDQLQAIEETPCNLEALFAGEDPWDTEEHVTEYFTK